MLEATRKEAEAKKEAKALKEENERLRRQFESYRPAPAPEATPAPAPKGDAKPESADFDNYEDFVEARSRWAARQEYAQEREKSQKEAWIERQAHQIAQTVEADVSTYQGNIQQALAADPDALEGIPDQLWDYLIPTWQAEPGKIHQGNVMADEIMKLDNPVAVLKHLGGDFKEFQRIATLQSAPAITRALARLDARFEVATPAINPKPKISAAKPPVRPVTGQPGQAEVDENDMSFEQFVAHDRKQARR
jgi:hypothetical protein